MNTRLWFRDRANFSTGSDSPVRVPWLMKRSFDDSSRTSPGIMSPAANLTTSPGTRSRSGISLASPSRTTVAVTWIMALSFCAAASARTSCQKRSTTLSATIIAITVPPRASPVRKETIDSVVNRITSGLRVVFRRRRSQPCFRSCAISFGPAVRARSSASSSVKPLSDVRKSTSTCSPLLLAASTTAGETRIFCFFALAGIGGSAE